MAALLFEGLVSYRLESGSRFYFQNDWHDLKNHNSQVLFIGNSRIWVQVNPFYIDSVFNIKSEVIAQDGQTIDMLWYKFREYTRHNDAPKELYVLADPFFWRINPDLYGIHNLRTYFFMNRIDMRFLKNKNGYQWFYTILPTSVYDLRTLVKVIKNDTVTESFENTRGFISQDRYFDNTLSDWTKPEIVHFSIDSNIIPYVDSFYTYCMQNNTKLYFIFPPMSWPACTHATGLNAIDSIVQMKNRQYGGAVPLLNYNDSETYNDSCLFYSHMHLNTKGVSVFMQQFTNDPNAFTSFRKQ
jgi:hypothetical protein